MTELQNTSGTIITHRRDLMMIATKFYKNLYTNKNMIEKTRKMSNNNEPVPSFIVSEIRLSMEKLKMGKSPGSDGVTNEMIKAGKEKLVKLFNLILHKKEIPKSWTSSEIVLLYKKGDPKLITSYRPISLISCLYKVFASTLLRRITKTIDENQPIEQAGFMKNYSTVDHMHTLKLIIEKYKGHVLPLYIAFIDFSKAFDSISHNSIWNALTEQGIDQDYIELIKIIYAKSTASR